MTSPGPNTERHLVLLGGGHSHCLVLRHLERKTPPGTHITIASTTEESPYSGMLPGHIAGAYYLRDIHIDLRKLARFAGADLVVAEAVALDLDSRTIHFDDHPSLRFDVLSINVGSVPTASSVPGASQFATPVKPVPTFSRRVAGSSRSCGAIPGARARHHHRRRRGGRSGIGAGNASPAPRTVQDDADSQGPRHLSHPPSEGAETAEPPPHRPGYHRQGWRGRRRGGGIEPAL